MQWLKIPKTYFKEGCTPEALKDLVDDNIKKVVVVTDGPIWGIYGSTVSKYLRELGIDFTVFTEVQPNPQLSDVNKGLDLIKSYKPDALIGFGGGSAIDAGKLMWFFYENPTITFEEIAINYSDLKSKIVNGKKNEKRLQFIAIPTTSGTGSEVTPVAVISDNSDGENKKYPLVDYSLTPSMAVVDVQFHMNMPKYLTAVSGMDALAHGIESYVSVLATEFTSPLSLQAITMVFNNLPSAVKNGANDKQARINMAHASTLAGMAFSNAFLGIVHSLSHKVGAEFELTHGHANAIFLPYVIRFNSLVKENNQSKISTLAKPIAKQRYAEIARAIGLTGSSDDDLVNKLIDKVVALTKEIGLSVDIKSAIKADEKTFLASLPRISKYALEDICTGANPRYPSVEEMSQIYTEAFSGKDAKKMNI